MSERIDLKIYSYKDGDDVKFNLNAVPPDLMNSLAGALKNEYQNYLSRSTDPSFREARAQFLKNVTEGANERGLELNPKQLLLGFKT